MTTKVTAIWHKIACVAVMMAALTRPAWAGTCQDMEFNGQSYSVCKVSQGDDLRLFLNDGDGAPLGSFAAVDAALAAQGLKLGFAMNAGMYHPDRRPVGLYIEQGAQMAPLVRRAGPGNFGLRPNGVFCIASDHFEVLETLTYADKPPECRFASQSGPMLVIGGQLHPKFTADSASLYVRNGVGVSADGKTAYFAISNAAVNFHAFASLFRDGLSTPNALFFDGHISRLYAPELGRDDFGLAMGPMVGLAVPAN